MQEPLIQSDVKIQQTYSSFPQDLKPKEKPKAKIHPTISSELNKDPQMIRLKEDLNHQKKSLKAKRGLFIFSILVFLSFLGSLIYLNISVAVAMLISVPIYMAIRKCGEKMVTQHERVKATAQEINRLMNNLSMVIICKGSSNSNRNTAIHGFFHDAIYEPNNLRCIAEFVGEIPVYGVEDISNVSMASPAFVP